MSPFTGPTRLLLLLLVAVLTVVVVAYLLTHVGELAGDYPAVRRGLGTWGEPRVMS